MPLFFVVLGARIDLRGVVEHPAMLGLALALAGSRHLHCQHQHLGEMALHLRGSPWSDRPRPRSV